MKLKELFEVLDNSSDIVVKDWVGKNFVDSFEGLLHEFDKDELLEKEIESIQSIGDEHALYGSRIDIFLK